MPKYLQMSLYVSLDKAPNILKRALLRANCKECLIAELTGHASVPYSKIGKHLLLVIAKITSSDAMRPIFPNIELNAFYHLGPTFYFCYRHGRSQKILKEGIASSFSFLSPSLFPFLSLPSLSFSLPIHSLLI